MAHLLTALFFVTILPALTVAQENTCDRTLLANVVDAHGEQIVGLTKEQFRASLRGEPVSVARAKFETPPERIVVLVDTSPSMGDPEQWHLVKMIAGDIVLEGPSQARFSLATFSSMIQTQVGFDQTREAVWKAIVALNPKSEVGLNSSPDTALNDAILAAVGLFGSPQPGDTIYVITDGLDNKSSNSTAKALRYLEQRNIRLFAAVIENSFFRPLPQGYDYVHKDAAEILGDASRETGGSHVVFKTENPVKAFDQSKDSLHRLYNLIASFYLLGVKLPDKPDRLRELKLTVTDINGHTEKGTIVLHPRNVFPCAMQFEAR